MKNLFALDSGVFLLLSLFAQLADATEKKNDNSNYDDRDAVTSTFLSSNNISRNLQEGSDLGLAVCGGKPKGKNRCNPLTLVAPLTDTFGVRCCSDSDIPGFKQKSQFSPECDYVWARSNLGPGVGCQTSATYEDAVTLCENAGARLCTEDELINKCAKATGCLLNKKLVWSSTPPPTTSPIADPTTSPVAAPTTSPVADPTTSPFADPTTSPVADPTTSPVADPTTSPVAAPTTSPIESGAHCCSIDLISCYPDYLTDKWCGLNEGLCVGCNGYWIEEGNNCAGIALWGTCTYDESGCCPPATCVDQGWGKQCLDLTRPTPPTTSPVAPTTSPVAPTTSPVGSDTHCCSLNLVDCSYTPSDDCGENDVKCNGCGGYWIEEGNNCAGIALWGGCTYDESGCCPPATCVYQNQWYKQCLVVP